MYRLWLDGKLSMSDVDGPALPPRCQSIDDVMDMYETLTEWNDADYRMHKRQKGEE